MFQRFAVAAGRRCAAGLLALILAASPLAAQDHEWEVKGAGVALATTYCENGRAKIWVYEGIKPEGKFYKEIMAHEMQHVAQTLRFESCDDAEAFYKASLRNTVESEIEAFCASLPVAIANGEDPVERYQTYFKKIAMYRSLYSGDRGEDITTEWVLNRFRYFCQKDLPGYESRGQH